MSEIIYGRYDHGRHQRLEGGLPAVEQKEKQEKHEKKKREKHEKKKQEKHEKIQEKERQEEKEYGYK